MKGSSYLGSVKHHSSLWSKWQTDKELHKRIESVIEDRIAFPNLLKKYIRYLSKKEKSYLKILEEGCGTTIDSCILKKEFPEIDFYAIDLSKEAIELAEKICNLMRVSLKLEVRDANSTNFDSDYFNMVFSQGLVEHFDEPTSVLSEQYRILKKGGLSIISVPQRYSLFTIFKRIKMRFGKWEHGWEREYSFKELAEIGIIAGFKILKIDGYGFTLEDFVRNGIRKAENKFFNEYLSGSIFYFLNNLFFLIGILLGKSLRKRFCKNLVAVFER